MSKYEIDVWEYADEFKNLDTNETFYGYQVCELLEHKDQQISDLETKLAEAQKTIEIQKMSNNALQEENLDYRYDITDTAYEQAKYMAESWEEDYQQEITELKHQLAEKEKEIESLKHFKVTIGTMETNQVDISSTTYIDQDKISFAVEQLEKVREFCEKELKECDKLLKTEFEDDFYIQSVMARESMCFDFRRTIDNQIKQLKEKNNG